MCYIEVGRDGTVTWGDVTGAYERASRGQSQLYAVWPGEWASHLFVIDDLDEFGRAFGFIHDKSRTGLADHQHDVWWRSGTHDPNPGGTWVDIDLRLNCGCEIKDIKAFAVQIRDQKGWAVATSSGWGSSGPPDGPRTYSLRVRRSTLS